LHQSFARSRDETEKVAMVLRFEGVEKSYATPQGPVVVLAGADLRVDAGESVALLGESGSGKSTLLHLAGGLDIADKGVVSLGDVDLAALSDAERAQIRREKIGVIFQQFNLIPSLSVGANLSFQARLANRRLAEPLEALAARLGLRGLLERFPEQLSGGQQQRVAIGRALAAQPQIVLADEPTGNLDEATSHVVFDTMLAMTAMVGAALLMVTHSETLADRLDRRIRLSGGKIVI
jgi:putative ABC transport system ATP-binding protein